MKENKRFVLAIDFDDTIVTSDWPKIKHLKSNAKEVINKLYLEGHWIIINSCRSFKEEIDAIKFLEENKINYHEINRNLQHRIDYYHRECRKIGADIYLDDKSVGSKIINWNNFYEYVQKRVKAKPLIIALIGESGTGKSMIADYIYNEHNIPMIQSYTTRKPRYNGETGHTFITEEEFNNLKKSEMIAHTEYGGNKYCCLKEDIKDLNTYVIDEDGYKMLKSNPGIDVVSFRLIRQHNASISLSRQSRDKDRFTIPLNEFDYVIENDGTKEELYDYIDILLKEIVWW